MIKFIQPTDLYKCTSFSDVSILIPPFLLEYGNWQLKEMAEKIPEGDAYINDLAANGAQASHLLSLDSSVDLGGRITSQTAASSSHTINGLPNNANRTTEETEFVENAEPGVFFTVSVIPGGEKCLKRVRFRYVRCFPYHWLRKTLITNKQFQFCQIKIKGKLSNLKLRKQAIGCHLFTTLTLRLVVLLLPLLL